MTTTYRNPVLAPDQLRVERDAIRIFAMPDVQAACRELADHFAGDKNSAHPEMKARIQQAAASAVFGSVLVAVNEDPCDPAVCNWLLPAHSWMGLSVPDGRWGVDNPDNVYRKVPVDARSSYRVIGRYRAGRPIDISFSILSEFFGEKGANKTVGFLGVELLDIADDGSFVLTLDASPAEGRKNHIQLTDAARVMIIRETLSDWQAQAASELRVERLSGPRYIPKSDAALARRAAQLALAINTYFLKAIEHGIYQRGEPNRVMPPISAGANGGLVTQVARNGYYELADDEALVISADLRGARYLGVQLADLWTVSYDYWNRLSSLNHCEAGPGSDGRHLFVVSPHDPGVMNWLDGSGFHTGSITMRWQGLPAGAAVDEAMATSQIVKLGDLGDLLPPGTPSATPEARWQQQSARASAFLRRIT